MKKQQRSIWRLTIAVAFIAVVVYLPGLIKAGSLEPTAAPGPTMKTLDEMPPAWSQKLDSTNGDENGCGSDRFECVMDGEAVLDKETGLVWERNPNNSYVGWYTACNHCYQRTVSHRRGWRLPTVEEFTSLMDPDKTDPALPTGHPFDVSVSGYYWTLTYINGSSGSTAWIVNLTYGSMGGAVLTASGYAWCVRGGHGYDGY